MVSFAIVLFFAATGLTVNHPAWFAGAVKTRQSEGQVDRSLLPSSPSGNSQKTDPRGNDPQNSGLVQTLRTREHLHGSVDELRTDDASVSFSYRAPGYSADVTVDRAQGTYTVTEVRNGFVAVVNDLHKGRDAGKVWGWLIDLSAILLTLVSLTGLLILWFIYKRRVSGLIMMAAGLAFCLFVYKVFVP